MSKPIAALRSLLFAPGNHPRRVEKALSLDADAVILDLEGPALPGFAFLGLDPPQMVDSSPRRLFGRQSDNRIQYVIRLMG